MVALFSPHGTFSNTAAAAGTPTRRSTMPPTQPHDYQHFTKLYQEELARVLRNDELSPTEIQLLLHFIARTTYGNVTRPMTIAKIAESLDRDRSTISKALQRLEERRLVLRSVNTTTGLRQLTVTPWLVFMGGTRQRADAISAWSRQTASMPASNIPGP